MDVSGYMKQKKNWLFEETFKPTEKPQGHFLKAEKWLQNNGKEGDIFVITIDGVDYQVYPFKINFVEFVDLYGSDTDRWEGKPFRLDRDKKGKYVMTAIEEKI